MKNLLAKATIFRVDGDIRNHYFKGSKPTLKEMQKIVNGNIEIVYIKSEFDDYATDDVMVVNEDGLIEELPLNEPAMSFLWEYGITEKPIVGDVFVMNINLID